MPEPKTPHHADIESVIIDMGECCTDDYQSLVDWDVVHESLDEAIVALDRALATWTVCLWLCTPTCLYCRTEAEIQRCFREYGR